MKKLAVLLTIISIILTSCSEKEPEDTKVIDHSDAVLEESVNEESSATEEPLEASEETGKGSLKTYHELIVEWNQRSKEGVPLVEGEAETLPTKQEALAIYGDAVIDADYHDYSYIPLVENGTLTEKAEGLYPFSVWDGELYDKRWGYINSLGEVVVEPVYLRAEHYSGGYAAVEKLSDDPDNFGDYYEDTKATFIDEKGNEHFGLFRSVKKGFNDGKACVYNKDFQYHILYEDGTVEIGYLEDEPAELNAALDENYMLVYVDEKGNVKLETGIAGVEVGIDAPKFPGMPTCSFSDGFAFLWKNRYMDTEGNITYVKNGVGMYKCGLVMVYEPDENGDFLYGYADITGEIKIPCTYKNARDFSENGLALVFDDKYYNHDEFNPYGDDRNQYRGYINTEGEIVIPLEYYDKFDAGAKHMYPTPQMSCGIIELYKEGYTYFFNYKGEAVGKKPEMYMVHYQENGRKKTMPINLGMYYDSLKENK